MFERWKPIKGFEGLYEISDFGNVKSLDRKVFYKNRIIITHKGVMLKKYKHKKGYVCVRLSKNGKQKNVLIHRLVAEAFIPNPRNLPCVNHKTECKTFNHYSTLEWCDYSYNANFGTSITRRVKKQTNDPKQSKKILQMTKYGKIIKIWPSIREINRQLGFSRWAITSVCYGKQKTAYGFCWRFES